MKSLQYVDSKVAVTVTSTTYTTISPPAFANRATFYISSLLTGTGTATIDFAVQEMVPAFTAAPVVATSTTGTTGVFAVQTITMTGEPTAGSVKFGVVGHGTNTVFTTAYMPLVDIKNKPGKITDFLAQAGLTTPEDVQWSVVLGTGASTPTVFTATYSGNYTLAQTLIAVTGDRLYNFTRSGINFADWDGITQRTQASTATNYDVVRIGPGETGIADDDTQATYKINSTLPPQLVTKVTTVAAVANNTASYSVYVAWSS